METTGRQALCAMAALLALLFWLPAFGEDLRGQSLVAALQRGGYVILMRHASSPQRPPDAAQANPDNPRHERQLDPAGRSSAVQMGAALRELHVRIGLVLCSPTYRALETVRLAQLGTPQIREQLGDSGHSMQADTTGTRGKWLRMQVEAPPHPGTNTLLVTHLPNIMEAFPASAADLRDGGALIFRPDGRGGAQLVARAGIEEWPQLAAAPR